MNWTRADAATVRAAIARAWLGARGRDTLGTIVLRPYQRAAAARLKELIARYGGAMLADPVGSGKTYTALAAVRTAERLVIVAPAALRGMWVDALTRAGLHATFISYQALSRGPGPETEADFVIVDESHHVRNPATRRYRALARLCARVPVLLLSATPVHNRLDDLRAQLALFLGHRARDLDADGLAAWVVKRDADDVDAGERGMTLPRVADLGWLDIRADDRILAEILELPPPVPVEDGGDGGVLLTLSLIRQWGSSRAALAAALRRRLAQFEALLDAFDADRYPTRAQLRAWCYTEGALQLAFPQIASDTLIPDDATLIDEATFHRDGVEWLLRVVSMGPDPDDARAAALLDVMRRHPESQIVVFAEFGETVKALYRRLVNHGEVAMLTGHGGAVAGGRVTRRELLTQFAPGGRDRVPAAQRVRTLITTDLFSEGVNLQAADVVVHADLPWTPARCEQRIGRIRRMGSPHREVFVYAMRPPAGADTLLQLEARLRRKLREAARAVGIRGAIVPRLFSAPTVEPPATLTAAGRLTQALEQWLAPTADRPSAPTLVAAVQAPEPGYVAVVHAGGETRLLSGDLLRTSDDLASVLGTVEVAGGADANFDPALAERIVARLHEWGEDVDSLGLLEPATIGTAVARRRLLRRIDGIASRSPRHLRARYAPLTREARRAATAAFGAGAEQVLQELADARMPDDAWLNAVRTFAQLHARGADDRPVRVPALLLLVPPTSPAAADPP